MGQGFSLGEALPFVRHKGTKKHWTPARSLSCGLGGEGSLR
ncbi:hypothetical protein HMPREF1556_01712 [Porphyromonas sp. oral taxon 278 str. W7784]|nr:hypothetical protein HMPREF1556_01712 [Porphyromonas sp. oral taxon 278 str. W7784]